VNRRGPGGESPPLDVEAQAPIKDGTVRLGVTFQLGKGREEEEGKDRGGATGAGGVGRQWANDHQHDDSHSGGQSHRPHAFHRSASRRIRWIPTVVELGESRGRSGWLWHVRVTPSWGKDRSRQPAPARP
jgi:hypothetical protein